MLRHSPKLVAAAVFILCVAGANRTSAQTTADLQSRIDQRTADIQALEKEITGYQSEINALGDQESSLSSTIKSLDLTQKKLQADIAVTVDKIDSTNLKIQQLATRIGTTQDNIADDRHFVTQSLKSMNELGTRSLPELMLSQQSLSVAWNSVEELSKVESDLIARINDLKDAKTDLETNKAATEKAKADLVKLESQLTSQRKVVLANQADKNSLLKQTKSSEAAYQKLLKDKQTLKDSFEQEVAQYESQLKLSVSLANLPPAGSSVLSWPLDNIFITQYFGNTPFATANPQIYKGIGHNGVDFRASVGTPVKAAFAGVVSGAGNTDLYPGCYSFGKWVMIKHANGLSTLYAHLSLPTVSVGQAVSTGALIGYSGNTGYTTGPHLHFGVYATEGMEIKLFTNSKNCQGATVPIAALAAYLNPLSYLPPVSN